MARKEFHIQEPAWNKKDTGSIDDESKYYAKKIKLEFILSRRLMMKKYGIFG